MSNPYRLLFSPIRIGQVEIKNRLAMAPMGGNYASREGAVTDQLRAYYARRAEGGVGLVIVEGATVEPRGRGPLLEHLDVDRDELIPGFQALANDIQARGAKAFLQLIHAGSVSTTYFAGGRILAPSMVPTRRGGEIPRALEIDEIPGIVKSFVDAALRSKQAGFDGIELHACHDCLLSEFLSCYYNRRKDRYGGDPGGRTLIIREIVQQVRRLLGSDFPILVRINGEEPGGNRLSDTIEISRILAGVVDGLHITGPGAVSIVWSEKGKLVRLAEAVKKEVSVPVITTGGITHPAEAEEILRTGKADIIAMGRPLLADPDLPNKALSGQLDDLRECVLCHMCRQREIRPMMSCIYNFETGREYLPDHKITKANRPRKVMVIGGGPGGMEAARVAAIRGHNVTLYEKSEQLGGQLRLAGVIPGKDYANRVLDYLSRHLAKMKVEVRLGTTVTPELVEREKPDVAIVATGAVPTPIEFTRSEGDGQLPNIVTAHDILAGKASAGKYVLVVGAGATGAGTATVLAEQEKGVTLIDMAEVIAPDLEDAMREMLLKRLSADTVVTYTCTTVKCISGRQVILNRAVPVIDARLKLKEQTLDGIDTIVISVGVTPDGALADALKGKVLEVHVIGDAQGTRTALDAIHEGSRIGRII